MSRAKTLVAVIGVLALPITGFAQSVDALPDNTGGSRPDVATFDIAALFNESDELFMQEQRLQRQVNIAKLNRQLEELNNPQRGQGEARQYDIPALANVGTASLPNEASYSGATWEVQVVAGNQALLRSPSGSTVSVTEGATLPGGQTVKRITTTGVVLEAGGKEQSLSLPFAMN